jgi:hypothetical protein
MKFGAHHTPLLPSISQLTSKPTSDALRQPARWLIPIGRRQQQLRQGVGTNWKDDGSTSSLGGMMIVMT